MPRSGKEARQRLQLATLELFEQHGYDATTTAQIAERAGVTERTFFRHFADKREALFDGEAAFKDMLVEAVIAAPQPLSPLETLLHAFHSAEPLLLQNRPFTEPRQKLIAQTPALQERVLTKTASLTTALASALRQRGINENLATFTAAVGMATVSHAMRTWQTDPSTSLPAAIQQAHTDLQNLTALTGLAAKA